MIRVCLKLRRAQNCCSVNSSSLVEATPVGPYRSGRQRAEMPHRWSGKSAFGRQRAERPL